MDALILRFLGCEVNGNITLAFPFPLCQLDCPCPKPKPLWDCTQPLETCCRTARMRQWGKFRAMPLEWSRDRAARGKIPRSPWKSAALLGSLQPPPKALFPDIPRHQIFTATFNSFSISDWPEKSILHIQLPWKTCTQADFQGLQERSCKNLG